MFKCEEILKNVATNLYILKIDVKKGELLELKFIHHTPWSKWETKHLENPKNYLSLILKEDLPKIREKLKLLKTQNNISFVFRLKAKDGRIIFINPNLGVIKRESDIVYAVGYSEEVSEREELKNITEKIFSFEEIGILIYQEKVVFVNEFLKKVFGIKEGDDVFEFFKKNKSIIEAIKRRIRGEEFNVFRQEFEFIFEKRHVFCDYFSTTILYKSRYSGLVILLDKTLKVKKDKFLRVSNHIYDLHLKCKNIDVFLNSVVGFLLEEGFEGEIVYKNKKYGNIENSESVLEFETREFKFCVASKYENDFEGLESVIEGMFNIIVHSIETIANNKNLILLKKSFDESFQAVVITDEKFNVVYANKIFKELVEGEVSNLYEVFDNLEVEEVIEEKVLIGYSLKNRKFYLKTKIVPVVYDKKYYVFQGILLSDSYSIIDSLTNLLNRKGFIEKNSLSPRKALILMDIYEFKSLIETKGKEFADTLLQKIASFLQSEVGYEDIGRVGGDEFAFLIDLNRLNKSLDEFIQELIAKVTKNLHINVNIGVAIANDRLNNLEILLEKAYIALNQAVKNGVNTYEVYNEFIASQKRKFFSAQNLIKEAIEKKEFVFQFQPYVDSKTFEIKGIESLLRIKKDDKIIYPNEFIDVAEESGLISEIEEITFPMIVKYAKELSVNISFNLSAYSFEKDGFYESIPNIQNLVIEITERILSNIEVAKKRIDILKSKNIKVAIDDFGTGYSNFISLKELDFDILKIDMSFIKNIERSKKDEAIVKSIIEFAKTVGLKTIAEGVENENQVKILQSLGCDYLQGFYFYKPMEFDELKKLLGGGNGRF
ncbi:sensor domain-containing protein [Caminibacter sp.]